jgi:SAM-dependent methyltransferase
MLAHAGSKIFGLDFSQEMLDLAKEAAPGAELKRGDAAELPFDDASFDAVLCNFGMMHLPDQPRALSEISRVLRPDGQFLMATWAVPEISPAFGTVFGAIKAHADLTSAPKQPDLFTFARPDEAEKLLAAAGLRMSTHETVTPAWELSRPEELFDIFLTATVGASMLIKGQKPEVVDAIRDQITSTVAEKFAVVDGYRVPVPVAVVTAGSAKG